MFMRAQMGIFFYPKKLRHLSVDDLRSGSAVGQDVAGVDIDPAVVDELGVGGHLLAPGAEVLAEVLEVLLLAEVGGLVVLADLEHVRTCGDVVSLLCLAKKRNYICFFLGGGTYRQQWC